MMQIQGGPGIPFGGGGGHANGFGFGPPVARKPADAAVKAAEAAGATVVSVGPSEQPATSNTPPVAAPVDQAPINQDSGKALAIRNAVLTALKDQPIRLREPEPEQDGTAAPPLPEMQGQLGAAPAEETPFYKKVGFWAALAAVGAIAYHVGKGKKSESSDGEPFLIDPNSLQGAPKVTAPRRRKAAPKKKREEHADSEA